jgi:hypothetical protein
MSATVAKKVTAIPPSGPENPMMQTMRRIFPADTNNTSIAPDSGLMEAEKSASFKKARRGRSGSLLSGSTLSDKPETLGSPERIM